MNVYFIFFLFNYVYGCSAVYIMPELKKNILNFGYSVNFKYKGMFLHSFNRFYVVKKFKLPKIEDLDFTTFQFDSRCRYTDLGNIKRIIELPIVMYSSARCE